MRSRVIREDVVSGRVDLGVVKEVGKPASQEVSGRMMRALDA